LAAAASAGVAVQYPAGQLGEVYRRVIREDGINPDDMWRKQKELASAGRHLGWCTCPT
jgi:tRNA pseudouridine13 synthase